jgi:hypothetical protein
MWLQTSWRGPCSPVPPPDHLARRQRILQPLERLPPAVVRVDHVAADKLLIPGLKAGRSLVIGDLAQRAEGQCLPIRELLHGGGCHGCSCNAMFWQRD